MNRKKYASANPGEYILAVAEDLGIDLLAPRVRRRSIPRRNAMDLVNHDAPSSSTVDEYLFPSQARYTHIKPFPTNREVLLSMQ